MAYGKKKVGKNLKSKAAKRGKKSGVKNYSTRSTVGKKRMASKGY